MTDLTPDKLDEIEKTAKHWPCDTIQALGEES